MVKDITDQTFKELSSNGKVVVDCFAEWCGPCKMLSPIIDELSEELTDVNFYKLNVDESVEVVRKYNIMSIPTILIFNDGELVNQSVGFKSKEELKDLLK
jgi:thioredoxin 1